MSGRPWLDALKEALSAEGRGGVVREEEERWDEDEADKLISRALVYLNERHLEAGKPDYDPAALDTYEEPIDEAYGDEDMGALRRAVRAYVVAGLREFKRLQSRKSLD